MGTKVQLTLVTVKSTVPRALFENVLKPVRTPNSTQLPCDLQPVLLSLMHNIEKNIQSQSIQVDIINSDIHAYTSPQPSADMAVQPLCLPHSNTSLQESLYPPYWTGHLPPHYLLLHCYHLPLLPVYSLAIRNERKNLIKMSRREDKENNNTPQNNNNNK